MYKYVYGLFLVLLAASTSSCRLIELDNQIDTFYLDEEVLSYLYIEPDTEYDFIETTSERRFTVSLTEDPDGWELIGFVEPPFQTDVRLEQRHGVLVLPKSEVKATWYLGNNNSTDVAMDDVYLAFNMLYNGRIIHRQTAGYEWHSADLRPIEDRAYDYYEELNLNSSLFSNVLKVYLFDLNKDHVDVFPDVLYFAKDRGLVAFEYSDGEFWIVGG